MVHAVLHRHAPSACVIDVTHQVPAHDVRAGALTLWRAAPWLAPGVVPSVILGVVDPGVGTSRRAVAIEVADAAAVLIGPDNGLLLPAAHRLGPITAAVELHPPAAPPPGATFAGRDQFAPAAGRMAGGAALPEVGIPIDPSTLAGDPVPAPVITQGGIEAEVLWVDRFGNAQLNATPADTGPGPFVLEVGGRPPLPARLVGSYGAIAPDQVALVIDSYGFLSVCSARRPAAAELGLAAGHRIHLSRDPAPLR